MSPHLRRPGVATGVVLFALLAVVDVLSPWIYPAPPEAPAFADALTLAFGVAALLALAVWLATSIRAAMWVGVVIRVIGALFAAMAFTDPSVATSFLVISIVYLVATIVGIVLVVPTLRARRAAAPTALA
jgi:cytochrome bd-type quinol oxidase subunit 1